MSPSWKYTSAAIGSALLTSAWSKTADEKRPATKRDLRKKPGNFMLAMLINKAGPVKLERRNGPQLPRMRRGKQDAFPAGLGVGNMGRISRTLCAHCSHERWGEIPSSPNSVVERSGLDGVSPHPVHG